MSDDTSAPIPGLFPQPQEQQPAIPPQPEAPPMPWPQPAWQQGFSPQAEPQPPQQPQPQPDGWPVTPTQSIAPQPGSRAARRARRAAPAAARSPAGRAGQAPPSSALGTDRRRRRPGRAGRRAVGLGAVESAAAAADRRARLIPDGDDGAGLVDRAEGRRDAGPVQHHPGRQGAGHRPGQPDLVDGHRPDPRQQARLHGDHGGERAEFRPVRHDLGDHDRATPGERDGDGPDLHDRHAALVAAAERTDPRPVHGL